MTIYHIATTHDWEAAYRAGQYVVDSLQNEGFIHFSTEKQVELVLNHFYVGREDVLLVVVDEGRLVAPLQYDENTGPDGALDLFPHLYGPLNLDAVIETYMLAPNPDGTFTLA